VGGRGGEGSSQPPNKVYLAGFVPYPGGLHIHTEIWNANHTHDRPLQAVRPPFPRLSSLARARNVVLFLFFFFVTSFAPKVPGDKKKKPKCHMAWYTGHLLFFMQGDRRERRVRDEPPPPAAAGLVSAFFPDISGRGAGD
jgi:hypothetical protein